MNRFSSEGTINTNDDVYDRMTGGHTCAKVLTGQQSKHGVGRQVVRNNMPVKGL